MLEKLITGGQTGVEQAAWAAARREGIATGGYMPARFTTEDGPDPRVGALYGAIEFPLDDHRRIRANLRRADALHWIGDPDGDEARATIAACRELGKPFLAVQPEFTPLSEVISWLVVFEVKTLVVSGERASRHPGLGPRVEAFLARVFAGLRKAGL